MRENWFSRNLKFFLSWKNWEGLAVSLECVGFSRERVGIIIFLEEVEFFKEVGVFFFPLYRQLSFFGVELLP